MTIGDKDPSSGSYGVPASPSQLEALEDMAQCILAPYPARMEADFLYQGSLGSHIEIDHIKPDCRKPKTTTTIRVYPPEESGPLFVWHFDDTIRQYFTSGADNYGNYTPEEVAAFVQDIETTAASELDAQELRFLAHLRAIVGIGSPEDYPKHPTIIPAEGTLPECSIDDLVKEIFIANEFGGVLRKEIRPHLGDENRSLWLATAVPFGQKAEYVEAPFVKLGINYTDNFEASYSYMRTLDAQAGIIKTEAVDYQSFDNHKSTEDVEIPGPPPPADDVNEIMRAMHRPFLHANRIFN